MDILSQLLEVLSFPSQILIQSVNIIVSVLRIIPPPLYILIALAIGIFVIRLLVGLL